MRVACLYDVHGNLPALESVLAGLREAGVDRIVFGGDWLPGPMPREVRSAVRCSRPFTRPCSGTPPS